jgi:hypothetical protein
MTQSQIIKNAFAFKLFGQKNVVVKMGIGIPTEMQKHYGDKKVGKWVMFIRENKLIFRMIQINNTDIQIDIPARDGYTIVNALNPKIKDKDLDTDIKTIITEQANLNGSEYDKYLTDYYVGIKLLKEYNDAKKYLDRWTFIWEHNKTLRTITKPINGILSPNQKTLLNK